MPQLIPDSTRAHSAAQSHGGGGHPFNRLLSATMRAQSRPG